MYTCNSVLCISNDMYMCTVSLCKCVCHPYKAVYPGSGSSHCCSAVMHQNDPCLLVGDSQSQVATQHKQVIVEGMK